MFYVAGAIVVVLGIVCFGAWRGHVDQQASDAAWFAEHTGASYIRTADNSWWDGSLDGWVSISNGYDASTCVKPAAYGRDARLADHFADCVREAEQDKSGDAADLPSAKCLAMSEGSREQLECIVAAEKPIAKERVRKARAESEKYRAEQEAEQKAEQAKRDAEDDAIRPTIRKAIEALHASTDTERRQAAITVSCAYDSDEAGYRVALEEYRKVSQRDIDARDRFGAGRYAVCTQSSQDDSVREYRDEHRP